MKTKVFIWWKGKTRGSGKGLVLTRQHEECRVLVRYEDLRCSVLKVRLSTVLLKKRGTLRKFQVRKGSEWKFSLLTFFFKTVRHLILRSKILVELVPFRGKVSTFSSVGRATDS